jgi:hypothetical protein
MDSPWRKPRVLMPRYAAFPFGNTPYHSSYRLLRSISNKYARRVKDNFHGELLANHVFGFRLYVNKSRCE